MWISRITPCIDFGHLNARTLGGIQSKADYAAILDRMAEVLGDDRARQFHVHFSRIEYSAGGEKRHWTFAETQFGPEPQPLMELLAQAPAGPGGHLRERGHTGRGRLQTMQQMYRAARDLRKNFVISSFFCRNPLPNGGGLGKINKDMR